MKSLTNAAKILSTVTTPRDDIEVLIVLRADAPMIGIDTMKEAAGLRHLDSVLQFSEASRDKTEVYFPFTVAGKDLPAFCNTVWKNVVGVKDIRVTENNDGQPKRVLDAAALVCQHV